MIAFGLNQELDPQKIISSIAGLIKKEVECPEDSVLVISISRVSQTVGSPADTKCLEA